LVWAHLTQIPTTGVAERFLLDQIPEPESAAKQAPLDFGFTVCFIGSYLSGSFPGPMPVVLTGTGIYFCQAPRSVVSVGQSQELLPPSATQTEFLKGTSGQEIEVEGAGRAGKL